MVAVGTAVVRGRPSNLPRPNLCFIADRSMSLPLIIEFYVFLNIQTLYRCEQLRLGSDCVELSDFTVRINGLDTFCVVTINDKVFIFAALRFFYFFFLVHLVIFATGKYCIFLNLMDQVMFTYMQNVSYPRIIY